MSIFSLKYKFDPVIISLAVFSITLHLAVANNLEYHRDELLYFSLGQHPAFGYVSVPPFISWVAWLMQNVFGYSVLAVRLFPALLSGAMIILVAALSKELGGSRFAASMSALGLIISIFFMRSFTLYQPVCIEIFLWTLCIYLIIKYINTSNDRFLIWLGITAGIALLNKYLVSILFLGLLVIIPFTEYRNIFRKRKFWLGIISGSIIFLPNFIWQATKGFTVINHMSELYGTQLVHMDIGTFLTEQLIMPGAATFLTVAGLFSLFMNKDVRKFRFLGFLALFVIIVLMLLKGKGYYTLGIFPLLIVAGAVSYEKMIGKNIARIIFPLLLLLISLPLVPIGMPVLKKEGLKMYFKVLGEKYGIDLGRRFEDGSIHSLPQDYADMIGWEELAALASKAYQMVPDKKSCIIYCENYGQAGAITVAGKKYNLPEAICFSESFRYWFPSQFDPDPTSFIYINNHLGEDVRKLLKKTTEIGMISDPDAREYGTKVYLLQEPVSSFNKFWQKRIESLR
jgi:hypothetical protein